MVPQECLGWKETLVQQKQRDRAVCEGYAGGLGGNLHQGGSARIWKRLEDFSDMTVTLAYKYFLDSSGGKLSANPVQN